ncbi:MAG: hypothetical protein AUF79_13710 [Crenarchaeota archaeon 13_1_20CM_2_51_8]|nr:MAG: hypothetical protein AUF79_13710 [Crenarchaeota archaeon 13_1_20CM_2_51_8]
MKQQDTLPGSKTANIPEHLQQPTKNTTRTYKDPMARSRSANVTRLITHVLSNQVTRDIANTALPILNTSNPDLKRTMNLIPSMANPSDWNEAPTIQHVKHTITLRGTNTTILKLPKHSTNTLNKNLQRLLNHSWRPRTRSQSQKTQISTDTTTNR